MELAEKMAGGLPLDQAKKVVALFEKKMEEYPELKDEDDGYYFGELEIARGEIKYRIEHLNEEK